MEEDRGEGEEYVLENSPLGTKQLALERDILVLSAEVYVMEL